MRFRDDYGCLTDTQPTTGDVGSLGYLWLHSKRRFISFDSARALSQLVFILNLFILKISNIQ